MGTISCCERRINYMENNKDTYLMIDHFGRI